MVGRLKFEMVARAIAEFGWDVVAAQTVDVLLDLAKYLQNRGVKKLNFKPQEEFKDPFGIQDLLTPNASLGLPAATK